MFMEDAAHFLDAHDSLDKGQRCQGKETAKFRALGVRSVQLLQWFGAKDAPKPVAHYQRPCPRLLQNEVVSRLGQFDQGLLAD
jgi:hypothetical protein